MVKYEERDVFMSNFHQQEIRDRMESDEIDVPQLFVDGQYIGVSERSLNYHWIVNSPQLIIQCYALHKFIFFFASQINCF